MCACQSIRQRAVPLPHSCTPAQPHALHITASPSSPCCHRSPRKATFQQPLAEPSAPISGLGRRMAARDAAGLTSGLIFYYFLLFFSFSPSPRDIFLCASKPGFVWFLLFFSFLFQNGELRFQHLCKTFQEITRGHRRARVDVQQQYSSPPSL